MMTIVHEGFVKLLYVGHRNGEQNQENAANWNTVTFWHMIITMTQ